MLVVDGSHLLHRQLSIQELSEFQDDASNYTGGIHGVLQSLSSMCKKRKCREGVIIAWDNGVPLWRREIYKEYKPRKTPSGEVDLRYLSEYNKNPEQYDMGISEKESEERKNYLKKYTFSRDFLHRVILPLTGCVSVSVRNCEADDIIAYWVVKISDGNDEPMTIISSDRDLSQLLGPSVDQYDPIQKKHITVESLIEELGLNENNWLEHFLWRKALMGDAADNIPGFDMVGKVLATELSRQISSGIRVSGLSRPSRTSIDGFHNVKTRWDEVVRNWRLIDLRYTINNNMEIIKDIKSALTHSSKFEPSMDIVEEKLDRLGMTLGKVWAQDIIEANTYDDLSEWVEFAAEK